MFYYIKGTVALNDGVNLVIDCNGVGYMMMTSALSAQKFGGVGSEATAYTYMSVRQDAVELYGFYDTQELETFKTLISVSGVGCKVAATILSALTPEQFALAVISGDTKTITKAQGVGPKLAQRIALELKDKMAKVDVSGYEAVPVVTKKSSSLDEAVSALIVLGYRKQDAMAAVEKCPPDLGVEDTVRAALRLLMK